jgi:2-C-methyl-D-erythritol 4-phosphate cytidylyltransferase
VTERVGALLLAMRASPRPDLDATRARLSGRPVLTWSLTALLNSPRISRVVILVASDQLGAARRLAASLASVAVLAVGGGYRAALAAGLEELAGFGWLVVHDAARPFLDGELLGPGLEAAVATGAAVAALPAGETVKRVANGTVVATLPRQELRAAQTPLVLHRRQLQAALGAAEVDITDEASLLAYLAGRLRIFSGSAENRKLSGPRDLEMAEACLASGAPGV